MSSDSTASMTQDSGQRNRPAESIEALVIGAGPAGLMAATELARGGARVVITEAMPTAGRKLLMAGKSGLNLTRDTPSEPFAAAFAEAEDWLGPIVADFGPKAVQAWARGLGVALFTGSSGRIFPVEMKASNLLRRWLAELAGYGVELRTRWRWTGWHDDGHAVFRTPHGPRLLAPRTTVLALGGASWARLGSDGAWTTTLAARGVELAPFRPANMGFNIRWSPHMARFFGTPVKGVALLAGGQVVRAEFVISMHGIEGGGVYAVSRALREGAPLTLDLAPDLGQAELSARLSVRPRSESTANSLRRAARISGVRMALMQEFGRPLPREAPALSALVKALPVPHAGPRPLDEAISVAGGISRAALTDDLELRAAPGVFAAGEMLDWEAPTGGYLLTACLATGRHAGRAAARRTRG